jgi:hypothetical protein
LPRALVRKLKGLLGDAYALVVLPLRQARIGVNKGHYGDRRLKDYGCKSCHNISIFHPFLIKVKTSPEFFSFNY